jgi:sugar (pentulose or hexulose) kinase
VVKECLGSGGATQSAVWCQIKADVYNKPFVVALRADGGEGGHGLGLYAMTAFAAGMQDDIGACVEKLLPQRQIFEPSPTRHALYEELFQIYRRVSRKLLEDFDQLTSITQKYAQQETK